MKKLISMTEFVLSRKEYWRNESMKRGGDELFCRKNHSIECENYANFLNKPLELGFFVPCDLDGNFLEEPEKYNDFHVNKLSPAGKEWVDWYNRCKQYQEARKRVLFEGCVVEKKVEFYHVVKNKDTIIWLSWNKSKTIRGLLKFNTEIPLTETALKQIGINTN